MRIILYHFSIDNFFYIFLLPSQLFEFVILVVEGAALIMPQHILRVESNLWFDGHCGRPLTSKIAFLQFWGKKILNLIHYKNFNIIQNRSAIENKMRIKQITKKWYDFKLVLIFLKLKKININF